jgi:hypothetical protein
LNKFGNFAAMSTVAFSGRLNCSVNEELVVEQMKNGEAAKACMHFFITPMSDCILTDYARLCQGQIWSKAVGAGIIFH